MTIKSGIVLGFDFGIKRVGVATGNTITRQAKALCTITRIGKSRKYNAENFFSEIAKILKQWRPIAVIVGLPKHLDGSASEMTKIVQNFADELRTKFADMQFSLFFADERLSSAIAESVLKDQGISYNKKGNDLKPLIDAVSAQIILQEWLDNL